SRALCGLAQNSVHCVPATTNALRRLRHHQTRPHLQSSKAVNTETVLLAKKCGAEHTPHLSTSLAKYHSSKEDNPLLFRGENMMG
ncbi:hypothetical protein, partial [Lapidilactobacillus luobeiensis]|uniref:hypothetical protein n=1 Tax=Lapidilactobacillus luobeiensis TaxID=2950371 RepID=UPI0021C25A36